LDLLAEAAWKDVDLTATFSSRIPDSALDQILDGIIAGVISIK